VKSGSAGSWAWTWTVFSQGLPESAITDLAIHNPARLLRAATHGRAVWEIDLAATTGLNPDVYVRVNYNDTGRVNPTRQPWVEGHLDPTNVGYVLYHWMSADIKVRRSSLTGLPTLGSPVTYDDFAFNIGDYIDPTLHIETADASGTDRIFVEVHNRSLTAVPAAEVQVLLLWADATMALPPLPSGYAGHINSGDTSNWLAGSSWHFVDPTTPYRTPLNDLDVRTPQVVEYDLDFSTLGLPSTDTHVCLATFVIGGTDQISTNITDLNQLTMSDKHVAHRNLHLVTVPGGGDTPPKGGRHLPPKTVVLDCHNPFEDEALMDLVFDQSFFPGQVALILPTGIDFAGRGEESLRGGFSSLGRGLAGKARRIPAAARRRHRGRWGVVRERSPAPSSQDGRIGPLADLCRQGRLGQIRPAKRPNVAWSEVHLRHYRPGSRGSQGWRPLSSGCYPATTRQDPGRERLLHRGHQVVRCAGMRCGI
jgi:hypothetical protein